MHPSLFVSIRYVRCLADALPAQGRPGLARLLRAARINPASLSSPEAFITPRQLDDLLLIVKNRTGRSDIGLELGLRIPATAHDALGLAAMSAPSVDAALRVVERNYPLISGLYRMIYARGGSGGTVRFLATCPLNPETRLMHADILVGSFHAQLSRPLAAALSPVRMTFGAERPRHARRYSGMAPGGIEFLPDMPDIVRIFLPNADLDKRPAMANVQSFRRAERTCRQQLARLLARNSWRGWAEDWIRGVEYASPNLKAAAAAGNCSTRTLDRRLREEGTSFRKMVAEVRHQQAIEWLGEDHAQVSDVAARLGYNDVSNFSRAFRRASGKSPRHARLRSSVRSARARHE